MVESITTETDGSQNTAATDGSENTATAKIEFSPEQQKHLEQNLIPSLRAKFSNQQSQVTEADRSELERLRAAEQQRVTEAREAEETALAEKGKYDELVTSKENQIEDLRQQVVNLTTTMDAERQQRLIDGAIGQMMTQSPILPEMKDLAGQIFRNGITLDGQTYNVGVVEGAAAIIDDNGNRVIQASGEHLTLERAAEMFGQQYPAFMAPTAAGGSGANGTVMGSDSSGLSQYRKAQEKATRSGRSADVQAAMSLRSQLSPEDQGRI